MKFRNFGKALLMSALSAGLLLGVTSCTQSYTVGFLYVTGLQNSGGTSSHGIISGFKIDHNTGQLKPIHGLPVSSGGANPIRAVLIQASRYLYVLNQGVDASNGANCTSQTSPCNGASIVQFSVAGNGSLVQQETFYTQGLNPFRMVADASGSHIYVLDRQAPDSGSTSSTNSCSLALGSNVKTCGDITVFSVDQTSGRLSLVQNAQVTSASGSPLSYFPVPENPIDFTLASSSYLLTLSGTPTTGDFVFPYNVNGGNGQLTIGQNSAQPINAFNATSIVYNGTGVYVLDNDPITVTTSGKPVTSPSQILPFTAQLGAGGSLQAQVSGAVADDPTLTNPQFLLLEHGGTFMYVANTGNNSSTTNPQSGIAAYNFQGTDPKQMTTMSGSPFSSGAGPQCLVEDPSNQFLYTANYNDSTVTGHLIDARSGALKALSGVANKSYGITGPATYCVMNGRTS